MKIYINSYEFIKGSLVELFYDNNEPTVDGKQLVNNSGVNKDKNIENKKE